MFYRNAALQSLVLLAGVSLFSSVTWAAGGIEVSGLAGGAWYGGGGGTHPLVGAGAAFGLSDRFHLLAEFDYTPLGSASLTADGVSASGSSALFGFGGGVDYSFRDVEAKVRPYVAGVVGLDHSSASVSATSAATGALSFSLDTNSVYYGGGGGIRLFLGQKWGLKPEVRYQRSVDTGNGILFTLGFFYHFGQ